MKKSYKDYWASLVQNEYASYVNADILRSLPDFQKWSLPQGQVQSCFNDGLLLSLAGDTALADAYFLRAIEISEHLEGCNAFKNKYSKKYFPLNQAESQRYESYARIMMKQSVPSKLTSVSNTIFSWINEIPSSAWSEVTEERLISCLVLHLLVDRAQIVASIDDRKMKTKQLHGLLPTLKKIAFDWPSNFVNNDLRKKLLSKIDIYRKPSSTHFMLAFELALIATGSVAAGLVCPNVASVIAIISQ